MKDMKDNCKYCANEEKLDSFGYCIKYGCYYRSGTDKIVNDFKSRCLKLYDIPRNSTSPLGITSYVSNYYNKRTREANSIMADAKRIWGFVPNEILKSIPTENQEKWDKNIRW